MSEPLLRMDSVTKVFYTDEVERPTPWRESTWRSIKAITFQSPGLRGAASLRCSRSWDCSILRRGELPVERQAGSGAVAERARPDTQPRNRFHLPGFNLIGDLTVYENVELPLTYRGMNSAERKKRVNAALEKVGMAHRAKHLPSQLSGGQQQRARGRRARGRGRSAHPARRRAYRKPRLDQRRSGHGPAA